MLVAGLPIVAICLLNQRLLDRSFLRRTLLGERLAPPFTVSDFAKRLTFLLALANSFNWVAKRKDRKDFDSFGNTQHGIDLLEIMEAYPVRADALRPCRQNHRLDGPTRIGDRKGAVLHTHHNRQWSLRDIATRRYECTKLAQRLLVLYDDEVPGLAVHATRGQVARFDDLMDDWFRDRLLLKLAYCQDGPDCIKYLHEVPLFLNFNRPPHFLPAFMHREECGIP